MNASRTTTLSPEAKKTRKTLMLALGLLAFVVIIFSVSITRLGESVNSVSKARSWHQ